MQLLDQIKGPCGGWDW